MCCGIRVITLTGVLSFGRAQIFLEAMQPENWSYYSPVTMCKPMLIQINNRDKFEQNNYNENSIAVSVKEMVAILAIAVFVISMLSKSSPLYPFNDWVDTNIFLTVGKSVLHGKVLYRDIYEQKGPLLFLIYVLPAIISERSFIGVYLLECLSAFFFLFYSYKISKIFAPHCSLIFLSAYAFLVYSSRSFAHGGSVEELCIPVVTCSLYFMVRNLIWEKPMSLKVAFLNGLFIGIIFWIKYTMLGVYIGYIGVLIFINTVTDCKYSYLIKIGGMLSLGATTASIPVLIYFSINCAFKDLWDAYFFNNLFYYNVDGQSSLLILEIKGIVNAVIYNPFLFILIFAGLFFLFKIHSKTFAAMSACFVFASVFLYVRPTYVYYTFIIAAFAPFGLCMIMQGYTYMASAYSNNKAKVMALAVTICIVLFAFIYSSNSYLFFKDIETIPQYQLAQTINASENRTLLNYGVLDVGLYTMTGTIPDTKYFCRFNVNLQEMIEEQERYIEQATDNYVVTRDWHLESPNYFLVDCAKGYFEGAERTYYLYERKVKLLS